MARRMTKKELDSQFEAFLKSNSTSSESIDKFLATPPKQKAVISSKPWYLDDDSIDDSYTTGGKSFLKSKTPAPQHSTPIDGSGGGSAGEVRIRSHIDPVKREASLAQQTQEQSAKQAEFSVARDSLDDISEKTENGETQSQPTGSGTLGFGDTGGWKGGSFTQEEEAEKLQFFKELENKTGTLDYAKLNHEMSRSMSAVVNGLSPDRVVDENGQHKPSLLSKVSLLDSQENTPSSQRMREGDVGLPGQDTLNMIGTGFLGSNTSQEMAALQRAYKDIQSSPTITEHDHSSCNHEQSFCRHDSNYQNDTSNQSYNTHVRLHPHSNGSVENPRLEHSKDNPSNDRSTLNSQLQKHVIVDENRHNIYQDSESQYTHTHPTSSGINSVQYHKNKAAVEANRNNNRNDESYDSRGDNNRNNNADGRMYEGVNESERRDESIIDLLNSASPRPTDIGGERTVEDILREVEIMEQRARLALEEREDDVQLTSDLRSPAANISSPALISVANKSVNFASPTILGMTGKGRGRSPAILGDQPSLQQHTLESKPQPIKSAAPTKPQGNKKSQIPRSPSLDRKATKNSQATTLAKQNSQNTIKITQKPSPNTTKTAQKSNIPRKNSTTDSKENKNNKEADKNKNKKESSTKRTNQTKTTTVESPVRSPLKKLPAQRSRSQSPNKADLQSPKKGDKSGRMWSPAGHRIRDAKLNKEEEMEKSVESFVEFVKEHCSNETDGVQHVLSQVRSGLENSANIVSVEKVQQLRRQLELEKVNFQHLKESYNDKQREYEEELRVTRTSRDEEVNRLRQDKFILSAKVKESVSSVSTEGGDPTRVERLEKEVKEQEGLLEGYAAENRKLYEERKTAEKRSKIVEEEMGRENRRLLTELSTLRSKTERQEEELLHKGAITGRNEPIPPPPPVDGESAAQLVNLEKKLTISHKNEAALERELSVLRKNKCDLEEHIEKLISERETLRTKVEDTDVLQMEVTQYKSEIERQNTKLKWYAENQRLLDSDAVRFKDKDTEITRLKSQLEDLNTEVKEMEHILKRRHPNSVATLLMTAAAIPDATTNEKSPSTAVLEQRIKKLETELAGKDEDASRQLRSVEQKYNSVKLLYEDQISHLTDQLSGRISDPTHPHTHGVALSYELQNLKLRHKEEMSTLNDEVTRLNKLLAKTDSAGVPFEEYEKNRAQVLEKDSRIKVLELQLANKDLNINTQNDKHLSNKENWTMPAKLSPLVTEENQRLKIHVDQLQLDLDQQRVSLNKSLAESEGEIRKTKDLYEAKMEEMRDCHQKETQRILTQHLLQHSGSKVTELQSKLDTHEVMVKHLKDQLSKQHTNTEELSTLRQRETTLQGELTKVRSDLMEAKSHHTPAMRQFEDLRDKIGHLEKRHSEREREIREAITNTRRAVREEMELETVGLQKVIEAKNDEILKFRTELDAILDVLRILKQQGVILPT